MNKGKTIFSQIMSLIPERDFKTCVDRYKGNYRARNFSCKDQFLVIRCIGFSQTTWNMKRLPYLNYIGKDGTWNFTLNGSSNTFTLNLLRNFRECHISANLDCHMHILAFSLCKESDAHRSIATHYFKERGSIPYGQDSFK